jgi:hypothetical protein
MHCASGELPDVRVDAVLEIQLSEIEQHDSWLRVAILANEAKQKRLLLVQPRISAPIPFWMEMGMPPSLGKISFIAPSQSLSAKMPCVPSDSRSSMPPSWTICFTKCT